MSAWQQCETLRAAVFDVETALSHGDPANGMIAVRQANETICDLAAELVEQGVRAGFTQRKMARLLGVPESALRGARRELA